MDGSARQQRLFERTPGRCLVDGFTLVELMIALAIAAVLLNMAVPAFQDSVADVRLVGEQNRLTRAVRQARSESIKRGLPVNLCASDDGASCSGGFGDGWLVYADESGGTVGSLDTTDTIVALHASAADRFSITAQAIVRPNASATVDSLQFGPRGRADWTLGTITLCDSRGASQARALIINGAGGLRTSEPTGGNAALNANGNAVSCP